MNIMMTLISFSKVQDDEERLREERKKAEEDLLGIEVNSESIDIIFENKMNELMKRESSNSFFTNNTNNNNIDTSSGSEYKSDYGSGSGIQVDQFSESVSEYSSTSSPSYTTDSMFNHNDSRSSSTSTAANPVLSRRRQLSRVGSSVGDFYDPDSDKSLLFSKTGKIS